MNMSRTNDHCFCWSGSVIESLKDQHHPLGLQCNSMTCNNWLHIENRLRYFSFSVGISIPLKVPSSCSLHLSSSSSQVGYRPPHESWIIYFIDHSSSHHEVLSLISLSLERPEILILSLWPICTSIPRNHPHKWAPIYAGLSPVLFDVCLCLHWFPSAGLVRSHSGKLVSGMPSLSNANTWWPRLATAHSRRKLWKVNRSFSSRSILSISNNDHLIQQRNHDKPVRRTHCI